MVDKKSIPSTNDEIIIHFEIKVKDQLDEH